MKILVINGSPKGEKSNTLKLTKAFVEGISSQISDAEVHQLDVSKLNIKSCLGCFSCWQKTPGKCCIQDDMSKVIEELLWSDVTIWSFPLYYFGLPGKLKTLVDRQLPMNLPFMAGETENGGHPSRYDMSGKRTVLISTCGFFTSEHNYDSVIEQFNRFHGKGNYETIFCGEGELFRVPELSKRTDEYLSYVRMAGKEFSQNGISSTTREHLQELLYPRDVFEKMADASWGVDKEGKKEDDSLIFTKQMAALYRKESYSGKDIILDMHYTDIDKKYRIVLGKDGSTVTDDFTDGYTTLIETPYTVWRSIAFGEIEGSEALMKHLYRVDGDFNTMLKWDNYFGSSNPKPSAITESTTAKTNMQCMLIPWIVFWIAPAIDAFWGSIISILVSAFIPILFFKNKKTAYDVLSNFAVVGFSVLLLLNISATLIVPLSYLFFGVMWSISCFFKIPLTAHYSMNEYNGEEALKNPIFMKTNRILTAAWGVLYLVTPIWTYFLMLTDISSYVGLINSVLPILMGVFTA